MKLSASNIGWDRNEDETVYALLIRHKFSGIDVTPSALTPPNGLIVAGMQSLLFGHPELKIFEDEETREKTFEHLTETLKLAGRIGATACVFGSPANRRMNGVSDEKMNIAYNFFTRLAQVAKQEKTVFCLEPNPASYGTDFLTRTEETFEFVQKINLPGLRVNLDTGTMIINEESPAELIDKYATLIGHVHISAPNLEPVIPHPIYQETITALKQANYDKWMAIEMKKVPDGQGQEHIKRAVDYLVSLTGE